ncbi:uncharacterized protein LOC143899334 isoform X2 [Temnothorax americanus]|uniref:uncharacterized protein LOC143899334 isoform X2 n=1 Tax=Temnothorax americanus TaxID=1964332 RepID=UPI004068BEAA
MYNIGAYYGNSETIMEKMQKFETTLYKIDDCVLTLVERFDEAFIKLLKDCDLHSNEYVESSSRFGMFDLRESPCLSRFGDECPQAFNFGRVELVRVLGIGAT